MYREIFERLFITDLVVIDACKGSVNSSFSKLESVTQYEEAICDVRNALGFGKFIGCREFNKPRQQNYAQKKSNEFVEIIIMICFTHYYIFEIIIMCIELMQEWSN